MSFTIEEAIERSLFVSGRYRTPIGGPSFEVPVSIDRKAGVVQLRDGDCGRVKPLRTITIDEWNKLTRDGEYLFWKVGTWSFVRANDPAADEIRRAHNNPNDAGWNVHRLKQHAASLRADLDEALQWLREVLEWGGPPSDLEKIRELLKRYEDPGRGQDDDARSGEAIPR